MWDDDDDDWYYEQEEERRRQEEEEERRRQEEDDLFYYEEERRRQEEEEEEERRRQEEEEEEEYRRQQLEKEWSNVMIGRTEDHERLAKLLSIALEHHDVACAIPDLAHRLNAFVPNFSRAYSLESLTSKNYGYRGGMKYFKPAGWLRFAVDVMHYEQFNMWCVAYHGTMSRNANAILTHGLQRPGDYGATIAHGQARSGTNRTIYLSPSIEYAAHPVYAQFFEVEPGHWAQVVLQCRVRPKSFRVEKGSLGNKHWDNEVSFDPNFRSLSGLEWLLEDAGDVVVTGFMVREFGNNANASIYGETVCGVTEGSRGPEFEWTRLRAQEFRRLGLWMLSS